MVRKALLVCGIVASLLYVAMNAIGAMLTDTMHIVFGMATVLLMVVAMGVGAAAFGTWFRLYSIATMGILLVFGMLTGLDAPRIKANLPTPWVGVWERISLGAFLLWVVVLAGALSHARETQGTTVNVSGVG